MEQLAGELGGRARVAKVNVDDCPEEAERMGIGGIPTILLVQDGHVVCELRAGSAKEMLAELERKL